ncbi:MAG: TonB-dependent receptor, partial [Odoribacter sp.]|nr:TonB-dependent receptor [Odoribacter sp.]
AQQGGLISGNVLDKEKMGLPSATLKLDKHNRYTISDQKGYFEFLNVPAGDYIVEVSYIGFKTAQHPVIVIAGKNTVIDIEMEETSIMGSEVVIMGEMLRGQAKALNQQKTNSNISNIISADQVGRFPDANIGDALKRVPGITMQNDQGEARDIIIRGLAPKLNSVTLNGNRIPSAEGGNRNVQMDLIPADMISSVEVNKTLTVDMDADAIGGSVDLVTRAIPNKQRISFTLAGGYNPIREKGSYMGAFIYGNRFFDNSLGVVASISYKNKEYGSDNIEAVWKKDDNDNIYVSQFDIRKYDVQRIRRSFSTGLDYKINSNHTLSADLLYNWRDDRENRYRTRYRSIAPVYDNNDNITGYTGDIRRETKGGKDNSRNKIPVWKTSEYRIMHYPDNILSLKKLTWIGISVMPKPAKTVHMKDILIFSRKKISMTEDLSDGNYPLVNSPEGSVNDMAFRKLTENHNYTEEQEYSSKINVRVPLSVIAEQKGRLRFGVRNRYKIKERDNIFYSYEPVNPIGNLSEVDNVDWSGDKFVPGSKYIPGTFTTKSYLGNLDLTNSSLYTETLEPSEFLAKNYKAKENIWAGYVRWDQNISNDMLFILGLRFENTHIKYDGNRIIDEEGVEEIRETNSYFNLLPSVSWKYNIKDDLIVRAAFTTSLARPNYYNLVPYMNISTDDNTISVGNPDLKATYAYNFDLMVEKYFKSVGLISGGLFYKYIDKFIYTYRNTSYTNNDFQNEFPGLSNPVTAGEMWQYTQSRNGKGVDVFGTEVAFQRQLDFLPTQFLKNFGVYLNYTYTYSKAKGISDSDGNERSNMKLPRTAPHVFNASLSWENKRFSARASLNMTTDYIDALGADKFNDSYYDKQLFLDINASYKITSYMRIFAEGNNLTNQPLRYYQGSKNLMEQ